MTAILRQPWRVRRLQDTVLIRASIVLTMAAGLTAARFPRFGWGCARRCRRRRETDIRTELG